MPFKEPEAVNEQEPEPVKETEPVKDPEPVVEPATVEEPVKAPESEPVADTFVVEVEKKDGDKVGIRLRYTEGETKLYIKEVYEGIIMTYNATAAADKVVSGGDEIVDVNGVTGKPDEMQNTLVKDAKLRIVFRKAC